MGYNCKIRAASINAIPGIKPINNLIAKIVVAGCGSIGGSLIS